MKNSNWDENGNWIGDNIPDSTVDWGVKNQETVGIGETTGILIGIFLRGLLFLINISIIIAPIVGLIVLVVWLMSCTPSTQARDKCVAEAALIYQSKLVTCKADKLKYDQCNEKYLIESEFENAQVKCRSAE